LALGVLRCRRRSNKEAGRESHMKTRIQHPEYRIQNEAARPRMGARAARALHRNVRDAVESMPTAGWGGLSAGRRRPGSGFIRAQVGGTREKSVKIARLGPLKGAKNRLRPPSPALAHINFLFMRDQEQPNSSQGNDWQRNGQTGLGTGMGNSKGGKA